MTVQSITYPESVVLNLRDELERSRTRIRELEAERGESGQWSAVSEARAAARRAQQELIDVRAELERTQQEFANQPSRRELGQLQVHCESLERKVAEQSGRIAELEALVESAGAFEDDKPPTNPI